MSSDSPIDALLIKLHAGAPIVSKSLDEIRAARGLPPSDPVLDPIAAKLRSGKLSVVEEGLKELRETGDGALHDRLLEGATFEHGSRSNLLPVALSHVLITLLLEAPASSKLAPALRETITSYVLKPDTKGGSIDRDYYFSRLPSLISLEVKNARLIGSAPHPRLKRLTIIDSEIDDLAGLAASPSLSSISLSGVKLAGGAELTNLDAIEGATALEQLTVQSQSLVDVRALAATLNLQCLKLEGCSKLSDISALEGHPSLRAAGLFGTAVDMKTVAKPLRELCSWAKNPNYEKMLKKPPQLPRGTPPPKKRAPSAAAKTALAELKALLATSDQKAMAAWLETIAASGDETMYDTLLEPVSFDPDKKKLASRTYRGPLGTYAMLGLLAGAPASSRVATNLRTAIKDLKISGPETDDAAASCPIDLFHLEALPNLETIELRSAGPFVDHGARKLSLPLVRSIDLFDIVGLEDLDFLGPFPKLESLNLSGCDDLTRLDALSGNATISRLTLWNLPALTTLKDVRSMPGLHILTIAYCSALTALNGLEDLPDLKWLELKICENISDIEAIRGLSALERLELEKLPAVQSLEPLRGHPRLEFVEINGMELASIEPLGGVPSLETLYLNSPGPIATLAPLAGLLNLTFLSVSRCPKLRSIDSLAGLPLRTLRLQKTGVTQVPAALDGVWERDE